MLAHQDAVGTRHLHRLGLLRLGIQADREELPIDSLGMSYCLGLSAYRELHQLEGVGRACVEAGSRLEVPHPG